MDSRINDFLEGYTMATLASVRSDGSPQAATIFYVVDTPVSLVFKSRSQSDHMTDLKRDARAGLSVYDHSSTYAAKAGLQLRGVVESILDAADMASCVSLYSRRFNGASERFAPLAELVSDSASSTLYRFRILQAKFTDGATDRTDLEYFPWDGP